MEYSLYEQLLTFAFSLVCGACLGVLYEVLRLLRELSPWGRFFVFFCDVLFMLVFSFVSVLFSVCFSRGNTRYFIIFGELLGLLAVRFTIGALNTGVFVPFGRKILKKCGKFAGNMGKTIKKLLQVTRNILYNKYKNKASVNMDKAGKKYKSRGKRYHGVKTAE